MIDFVDASPFLRISLRVAMATMHFHILAQTGLFLGNIFFRIQGGPREQYGTHEKISLGCKVGITRYWCKTYRLLLHKVLYFILYLAHRFLALIHAFFFFKYQFWSCGKPRCHSIFICNCLCLYCLSFVMKKRSYCI